MSELSVGTRRSISLGVVIAVVVGLVAIAFAPHASSSFPRAGSGSQPFVAPANSTQWAFGGNASGSFACSPSSCGSNLTNLSIVSLSYRYYLQWVVIYTQTNVSPTQTEMSAQGAINVSAAYAVTMCLNQTVVGQPCTNTTSISVTLTGLETISGSTNLTDVSMTLLSGPGAPGTVSAWGITNASSHETYNFSGSYSFQSSLSSAASGSANFDFGGWATTAIAFPVPLAVVPKVPLPAQMWSAAAPFTETGHYVSGYSISGSSGSAGAASVSIWTPGTPESSGTLTINGTDLGPSTLTNGYTSPPTQVVAQSLGLTFSGANISGQDGWVLGTTDLYGNLTSSFGSNGSANTTSTETAYFVAGQGFVGADLAGNTSSLSVVPGAPAVVVQAGPEPVSVARQQYSAMTAASGGSSGFPAALVLVVVAVVAVAAVAGVLLWKRQAGRRPPTPTTPPDASVSGLPPAPPASPPTPP